MPRPIKKRNITSEPEFTCFKPAWIPRSELEKVELLIDEYESLRLSDYLWLSNIKWALKMWISPPTFNRLIWKARKKISEAIIEGKWIRIYKSNWTHNCN